MNLHNIRTISRYESKLLRRSWLFRIFAILALLVITSLHLSTQSNLNGYQWNMVAISSSIPFVKIYIFNIAQSIIAIFLAGDFMKRDKKLDTAEVTYVRPMSNTDYIAGKTWGIIRVFVGLNIIALLIAAFINIFASESPLNPMAYLFYLITLSIPSLVFILGLSFVLISMLKNQAVTLILLLGYIGATLIYLGTVKHGAFDFFAATLPNIFSDVTGHPNLYLYLLQRIVFFLLGIGLLTFTIVLVKRLPQRPRKKIWLSILGGILLLLGTGGCLAYMKTYSLNDRLRMLYLEKYREYQGRDYVSLDREELLFSREREQISVRSRLTVSNRNHREINAILLYLNPTLSISRLESSGLSLTHRRDEQVIIIDKRLGPFESTIIELDYSGPVSEAICYLDVPDSEYYNTNTGSSVLRFGKKYCYVDERFTLLTPEALWYPVSVPPVNPESPYNIRKNFTDFSLKVLYSGPQTVLSQGTSSRHGDTISFAPPYPLPSLALTIGDYEKKSVMLDTVEIELYNFKGHDYFSGEFSHLQDTLTAVLKEFKNDYEVRKNRDYPFSKLILAETPVSFASYVRNWRGASEFIQPEMILLPERGATLPNAGFKLSKKRTIEWERERNRMLDDTEVEIRVLREFINRAFLDENTFTEEGNLFVNDLFSNGPTRNSKLNKYDISALFFNHTNFIYSANFPVMDILLNVMLKQEEAPRGGWWRRFSGMNDAQRASEYLKEKSFEQAIQDRELLPEIFYEMLKLKGNYLRNYVLAKQSFSEFSNFMKTFSEKYRFTPVNLTVLNNEFLRAFGINLMDLIPEWYTINRIPYFIVRGLESQEVTIEDYSKYLVTFSLHNPSEVEGIVSVRLEGGRGPGGGRGGPRQEEPLKHYVIPAGQYKEIRTLSDYRPNNVLLNTNISQNLPSEVSINIPRAEEFTNDTVTGMFDADSQLFAYNPKEITVDNEDSGFRLIESNQKNTLQTLFNINTEDRYQNMNFWFPPTRWTATIGSNYHGDYIKSGYYKKAGSGRNMAEWRAEISIPGYYEIYVYNAYVRRGRDQEDTYQYYTISHDDGEEQIVLQTNQDPQVWVSVGNFYFSKGETKITLTDRGGSSRQFIFADAVRWVYRNN